MRRARRIVLVISTLIGVAWTFYVASNRPSRMGAQLTRDLVMAPGDVIEARTQHGTLTITATGQLERRIAWAGHSDSKTVTLYPSGGGANAPWLAHFGGAGTAELDVPGLHLLVIESEVHVRTIDDPGVAEFIATSLNSPEFTVSPEGVFVEVQNYRPPNAAGQPQFSASDLSVICIYRLVVDGNLPQGLPPSQNAPATWTRADPTTYGPKD